MLQKQQLFKVITFIGVVAYCLLASAEAFHTHGAARSASSLLRASSDAVKSRDNTGTSALYEPPSTAAAADATQAASDAVTKKTAPSKPAPRIQKLQSLNAFCDLIDNAPPDTLVAVKFYGKSCPLCRKVSVKYQKMARYYGPAPIQFTEIEKTVHPQLFDELQITTFPYLQLYRNGQCIASHATVSESVFERIVNDTIQQFLGMAPTQWDSFLSTFAEPIGQATANYERVRGMRK